MSKISLCSVMAGYKCATVCLCVFMVVDLVTFAVKSLLETERANNLLSVVHGRRYLCAAKHLRGRAVR